LGKLVINNYLNGNFINKLPFLFLALFSCISFLYQKHNLCLSLLLISKQQLKKFIESICYDSFDFAF